MGLNGSLLSRAERGLDITVFVIYIRLIKLVVITESTLRYYANHMTIDTTRDHTFRTKVAYFTIQNGLS